MRNFSVPATDDVQPNILIVDDTPDNLRLLVKVLSEHGYSPRPVTDGKRAIAAAQLDPPDLVLLDIKMPGMDGYEVCQQLKADERTCDVPIMFLTVLDDEDDIVKGFEIGGVDYVTKPVRPQVLLARIKNQVGLRSLQRKMIAQREFMQNVYDAIEAGVSVIKVCGNGRFRMTQVNQTALRMAKLEREELEGVDLRRLMTAKMIRENQQAAVALGGPVTKEVFTKKADSGEITWWLNTHTPLRDEHGEIKWLVGTGVNITDRKQTELQLAEKTEALSQTLQTLKSAQSELIRSAKMAALGNLVAGVAHEINTPVGTAITSASTLENATEAIARSVASGGLKRSSFEGYLEVASECSQLILSNLHRAGELVQSFKKVAVDQSSLKMRTFALKLYLQEIVTNLMPTINRTPHRITLIGNDDITVYSCPGALAQVVTNLVINSLSHAYPKGSAPESGTLRIAIHEQPDQIILQYTDDGCGIDPEHQGRIFEPFFTTARELGGSGLGLHLVYNLITQTLQGNIHVASTPGMGTTFTITLPSTLPTQ